MPTRSQCVQLGPAGAGQLTKMVNQICIAGLLQGLAEGVNFAKLAGLDVDQVVDVIGKGAAQSWQMDNRARTMAADEFEFGFAVEWMRKDLGIVPRRSRPQRRTASGDRTGRPVLQGRRRPRRRTLGHQQPDPPAVLTARRPACDERSDAIRAVGSSLGQVDRLAMSEVTLLGRLAHRGAGRVRAGDQRRAVARASTMRSTWASVVTNGGQNVTVSVPIARVTTPSSSIRSRIAIAF